MQSKQRLDEDARAVDAFQLLLEHATDAIAEYDASLRYTTLNAAIAAWFDWVPDDMLGKTPTELVQRVASDPVKRGTLVQIADCVQRVREMAEALVVIHEVRHKTEVKFYETAYTPVLNAKGHVCRIFSIGRDVTRYLAQNQRWPICELPVKPQRSPLGVVGLEMPEPTVGPDGRASSGMVAAEMASLLMNASATRRSVAKPDSIEQQQAQAAQIRQSAELLRLVLDNIPQYIFWKNRDLVYLGCNRQWAEMTGIGDPEQMVGLTDADLPWTPEQREWYLKCDREVMETDTPMLRIKESQLQADGKLTWRETTKLPLHDADGNVIGLLGTVEDVTDRKLAEDVLRQSEAKFRKLAQHEELLNRLSSQIRNSLDLKTLLSTAVREVRRLLDTDRVVIYQFGPDWQGSVVVEDVLRPWDSTLGEMGADNCFPEKYADLYRSGRIRAIPNILDAGLDECHVSFLQRLQVQANLIVPILTRDQLWGLLVAHECRGPRVWQDDETDLLSHLAGQIGIAIQQAELYAQANQNAEAARSQAHQLKQALRELKKTQSQLIQTEKMSGLGQLVAGIAHEINNPVNFIYGNLSPIEYYVQDLVGLLHLYQEHYPEPKPEIAAEIQAIELDFVLQDLSKILKSMRVGADRIRQIVLSLRTFSRLDEAEVKAVDLHEGLESTLLILQHRMKPTPQLPDGIQVIKTYGNLPPVECYPSQMNQVFMNILSNAVDALEEAHAQKAETQVIAIADTVYPPLADPESAAPKIWIVTEVLPETQRVAIRIRDNGSGIPAHLQLRLFDPFFTTKPIGKGTGLGLSISHQIVVERHSGTLRCSSPPRNTSEGTEFCIEVPIAQPELTKDS